MLGDPLTSTRPLVAAAAASVLAALYFMPTASASPGHTPASSRVAAHAPATRQVAAQVPAAKTSGAVNGAATGETLNLADTGSVDTTPYLLGGSLSLVVGAALVLNATRRTRYEAAR